MYSIPNPEPPAEAKTADEIDTAGLDAEFRRRSLALFKLQRTMNWLLLFGLVACLLSITFLQLSIWNIHGSIDLLRQAVFPPTVSSHGSDEP